MFFGLGNNDTDPRGGKYKEYAVGVRFDEGGVDWFTSIPEFAGRVHYQDGIGLSEKTITEALRCQLLTTLNSFIKVDKETTIYWRVAPEFSYCDLWPLDSPIKESEFMGGETNAIRLYFRLSYYND